MYQFLELSSEFRLIALDQRCFGRSSKTQEAFDISIYGNDLDQFLDVMDIPSASIVGVSLGSIATELLALQNPSRIRRMVLVSTTSSLKGVPVAVERLRGFKTEGIQGYQEKAVESLFSESFRSTDHGQFLVSAIAARTRQSLEYTSIIRFYDALKGLHIADDLDQISIPTLVLGATEDFTYPLSQEVARRIPNAQLLDMPGCGRLIPLEAPREFNRIVKAFLQS